jgi:hypothetical protein
MNTSVSAFLKTEQFENAAHISGNSQPDDFSADSDGRVARSFSGDYTVDEVLALLRDLQHVQKTYDHWKKMNSPHQCMHFECCEPEDY